MAKNIATGLDIGSHSIKVMVAEKGRGDELPRVLGMGEAESRGVRKGCVVDVEEASESIAKAVKDAEKSAGISIKHAFVSLGGTGLDSLQARGMVAVSRPDSEITQSDIHRAIEASRARVASAPNKEILHTHPLCFTIDGDMAARNPVGMISSRLEVDALFTTGVHQHVKHLVKSAEKAGVAVEDVVASPFAASRAVLSGKQREVGVAVLDLGSATCSLAVFEEDAPLSAAVFPIGSWHITRDIAIGFQIPLEQAEDMKRGFDSEKSKKDKLSEIVGARMSDVFEVVEKHLKKIDRNRLLPAGVVITGGGANLKGVADFCKHDLQLPATVSTSFAIQSNASRAQDPKWSTAVGLALYALDEEDRGGFGGKSVGKVGGTALRWLKAFLP